MSEYFEDDRGYYKRNEDGTIEKFLDRLPFEERFRNVLYVPGRWLGHVAALWEIASTPKTVCGTGR